MIIFVLHFINFSEAPTEWPKQRWQFSLTVDFNLSLLLSECEYGTDEEEMYESPSVDEVCIRRAPQNVLAPIGFKSSWEWYKRFEQPQ